MTVDLSELLSGERHELCFETELDISDLSEDIVSGAATVRGKCTDRVGFIELPLKVSLSYEAVCARCAETFSKKETREFLCRLVPETADNDEEEYYSLTGTELDTDALVRELLTLSFDRVLLCSPDCKGVCAVCGGNRNKTVCSCETKRRDPRLSALGDLAKKLEEKNND